MRKSCFLLSPSFSFNGSHVFYFALHGSDDTVAISQLESSAVWGVVVLVTETILQETRYHVERFLLEYEPRIPIRVGEGKYEWVSSINRYREQHPTPGASIGLDGNDLNSATLGGYVVGETSNQVFAMTVGHMCFDEPQPLNSPPPPIHLVNQLMQPSGQDSNGQRQVLQEDYEALMGRGEVEAAAEIKKTLDHWWYSKASNAFAMPVLATWTTTSNMTEGEIPEVQDLCLASVYETRTGNNATSPVSRGFRTGVRGIALITPDHVVYKVGRSTGYTEGRITSMKPSLFFDKRLGCKMTSYYFEPNRRGGYDVPCEMGDCGSWLINAAGKAVGMLHGAVLEKIDPNDPTKIILSNGCFTPIQKCLGLCEKYLGEKFHVMT
jgi:hypothetical protein